MDTTSFAMLLIYLAGSEGFPGLGKPSPLTPEVGKWYQIAGRYDTGSPSDKSKAQTGEDEHSSGTPMDSSSQVIKAENAGHHQAASGFLSPGTPAPWSQSFNGQRDAQYSSGTPHVSSRQTWNDDAPGPVSKTLDGQSGVQHSCNDGQCSPSKSSASQSVRQKRSNREYNSRSRARRFLSNKQKRSARQHSSSTPGSSVSQNTKKKRSVSTCPDLSTTLAQIFNSSTSCSGQCCHPIVVVLPCCQQTCVQNNTCSSNTSCSDNPINSTTSCSNSTGSINTTTCGSADPSSNNTSSNNTVCCTSTSSSGNSTSSNTTTSCPNSTDSSNTTSTTCVATDPSNNTSVCVYSSTTNPYNSCSVNAADVISQLLDTICKLNQASANSNVYVNISLQYPDAPTDSLDVRL